MSGLEKIYPLEELDDLQVITARKSGYLDLTPLKNMRYLRKLDLSFSDKLAEISTLSDLTGLESFYYSPNSVDDEEILELEKNLPDCDFYPLESEKDEENASDEDDGCGCGHDH